MNRRYWIFTVVTGFLVILDQVTKYLVVENLRYRIDEIVVIDGFFSIVHAQNTGAAFGVLAGVSWAMWFFYIFTVIALVVLLQMLVQLPRDDRFQTIALALITSGAVGNVIDRIHKQSVTDFLRVYVEHPPALRAWLVKVLGTNEWPSFNVADSAICVGLGLFVIHFLFLEKDEEVEPDPPEEVLDEVTHDEVTHDESTVS